jgi:hypothetical protein
MNFRAFTSYINNFITITSGTIALRFLYQIYCRFNIHNTNTSFGSDKRLHLVQHKEYSREEIISLGQKAIRDKNTNKVLNNPIVNKDGYSIEQEDINSNNSFQNRIFKEFLDRFKQDNHYNIP